MKNCVKQIVRICPQGVIPLSEASKKNSRLNVDLKATDRLLRHQTSIITLRNIKQEKEAFDDEFRDQGSALFASLVPLQFGKWNFRHTYADRYDWLPHPESLTCLAAERNHKFYHQLTHKLNKPNKGAGLPWDILHLLCYNSDIFLHVLGAENKTKAGHSPLPW